MMFRARRATHRLIARRATHRLIKDAPPSTAEALIFDLRDRGQLALSDPANAHRIVQCTEDQLEEACRRLLLKCPAKPEGVALSVLIALRELHERKTRGR
jgi:hypothetical protein